MKKIIVILIFIIAFLLSAAGFWFLTLLKGQSFTEFSHHTLKPFLTTIFKREIEFKSFQIRGLREVVFDEVAIAKEKFLKDGYLIKAPKISIKFSALKLILTKGDFLKSILEIRAYEPEVFLIHSKENKWNILELFPVQAGPPPKIKIIVENGALNFYDEIGFWEKLPAPFEAKATNIFGEADFRNPDYFKYSVFGNLNEENFLKPVKSAGFLKWADNSFQIKLETPPISLGKWFSYVLKIPGVLLNEGEAALNLEFSSQNKPLEINGGITLNKATCELTELGQKSENISGHIFIKKKDLIFEALVGDFASCGFNVEGSIFDFYSPKFDLAVSGEKISLEKLKQNLPGIDVFSKLSGDCDFFANLVGSPKDLFISGLLHWPKVAIGSVGDFKNMDLGFKYWPQAKKVELDLKELTLYKGALSVSATIDFSGPNQFWKGTFKAKKIKLAEQPFIPDSAGELQAEGQFFGEAGQMTFNSNFSFSPKTLLFDQPVEKASLNFKSSGSQITLDEFLLTFKEKSYLKATGRGQIGADFEVLLTGTNIFFVKKTAPNLTNSAYLYFNSLVSGKLTPDFFKQPSLNFKTSLKLRKAIFFGQPISYGELVFSSQNNRYEITKIILKEKSSEIRGNGFLEPAGPISLNISGKNISLKDLKILSFYLPQNFKDTSGVASLDSQIQGTLPAKIDDLLSPKIFENISISSKFVLNKAVIGRQPLDACDIQFVWQNPRIKFEKFQLILGDSELSLKGDFFKTGEVNFASSGQLKLKDFDFLLKNLVPWLRKYDLLSGELIYSGAFSQNYLNPSFQGSLKASNLKFNQLVFQDIQADSLTLENKIFYFKKPLILSQGKEIYHLSGKIDLNNFAEGLKHTQLVSPQVALNLEIVTGRIETIYQICRQILEEVNSRIKMAQGEETTNFTFVFPAAEQPAALESGFLYQNYSDLGPTGFLEFFKKVRAGLIKTEALKKKEFWAELTGQVSGQVSLNGDLSKPKAEVNLNLKRVAHSSFNFDFMTVKGRCSNQALAASDVYDPHFQTVFEIKNAVVGEVNFSRIDGQINYEDGAFKPIKINFWAGGQSAELSGTVPYPFRQNGQSREVALTFLVEKEGLKIFGAVFKDWEWLGGDGGLKLKLTGPLEALSLNGGLWLKGASLKYQPKNNGPTLLSDLNASCDIGDNLVSLNNLSFKWVGKLTKKKVNLVKLSGRVKLEKIFTEDWKINFEDVKLADSTMFLDWPLIYSGQAILKNMIFTGAIDSSFFKKEVGRTIFVFGTGLKKEIASPGATVFLKGNVILQEGAITIPESNYAQDLPRINLEIQLTLGDHVKLVAAPILVSGKRELGGLITQGFLTGVDLTVEETKTPILITGTVDNPLLEHRFVFTSGGFSILGRPFVLIKPIRQRLYFAQNLAEVGDNFADFKISNFTAETGGLKNTLLINLKLAAETDVSQKNGVTGVLEKRKILARLDGPMNNLNLVFEEYKAGLAGPFEFIARYTLDDSLAVLKILMPEVFATFTSSGADRSQAFAQFSARQIQAIFRGSLRPVEEKIESSTGLDEVSLEYDLGERLARSMGVTSNGGKDLIGISLAKKLFLDKLYLRIKYAQDLRNLGRIQGSLLSYQLAYWLNDYLSFDYTREVDEGNPNLLYNDTFTFGVKTQL